jgi:hypothetical protein
MPYDRFDVSLMVDLRPEVDPKLPVLEERRLHNGVIE